MMAGAGPQPLPPRGVGPAYGLRRGAAGHGTVAGMTDDVPDRTAAGPRFPDGFLWGAATAAYQVEGAVAEDGRGRSIWDTFSHTAGRTAGGDTGDVACDHYHRYAEDLDLLSELGVGAYRFSVAWPRVLPEGTGRLEPRGLGFYDRLVDGLLARGIRPVCTLYHWDLPQPLEDAGGWPARGTAERFAEYAAVVAGHLGDRVQDFSTLNEPWVSSCLGYFAGVHAPGRQDPVAALTAVHHLLLGHGLAVQSVRAARPSARLSLVLNLAPVLADGPAAEDAVRRVDGLHNRLFLDPVLRGRYPEDVQRDTAHVTDWSFVRPGDLPVIGAPLDWLGVNYYFPVRVAAAAPGTPTPGPYPGLTGVELRLPHPPLTAMGWEQYPDGLRTLLLLLSREYAGTPLRVTENGAAFDDTVGPDGAVHDPDRVAFLDAHLRALHGALQDGADVRGYFVWSLLDNFEWAEGYAKRFGVVHVDFASQRRTVKDSGRWYRDVVVANALPPAGEHAVH